MSETTDTESSCGWTIISHEGSDIETLGTELVEDIERPVAVNTELQDAVTCSGGKREGIGTLDVTLIATSAEEMPNPAEAEVHGEGNEHVSLLSSSDHSDILTLRDVKDDEQITAEATEGFYLGTSCSSQYTFTTAETVFPVQQLVRPNSSSSEDESERSPGAVVRRRRMRRGTSNAMTKPEEDELMKSEPSEKEEDPKEHREPDGEAEARSVSQGNANNVFNTCIMLALIAISMGLAHFSGTAPIQEMQKTVDKTKVSELDGLRDLVYHVREQRDDLSLNDLDVQKAISVLSDVIDKIRKENKDLHIKHAQIQAQKNDLEVMLKMKAEEESQTESQQQRLMEENHQLKHSLDKEEKSLFVLQQELKTMHLKMKELETMGAGADSLLSENQRLKAELEVEKQVVRSFSGKKEDLIFEAQTLRKMLDKERKVTDELRRGINERISGAEEEASAETTELQSRLMEMEKRLSFEQQRSDLWERLYLETKEERAKGDSEPKMSKQKSKQGMAGKVRETFDAVKNSTKAFVHHHKERIKKAKEAVKENLRKFSDSVKSTFKNFKDSASTIFSKAREFYDERQDDKNMHEPRRPFKCNFFQNNHCNRKSAGEAHEEPVQNGQRFKPKSCSGVFDCAYQESMSLFNKATEPIRADEFYELLQSYLQQEVDHFDQWKELQGFINNFFHNGVFIHDQMLFTDFVHDVEEHLIEMYKYPGLKEDFFGDLGDYIYRHFFGETYYKNYSPSGPFERPDSKEDLRMKHKSKQRKTRQSNERKWTRSDENTDRHMADVKIELGPLPFDPKY